jgi:hypothetical protein
MRMNFTNLVGLTFSYFKNVFLQFLAFTLLVMGIVVFISNLHPYIVLMAQYLLLPLLLAGYYLFLRQVEEGGEKSFGIFFRGADYFLPLIVLGVYQIFLMFVAAYPYTLQHAEFLNGLVDYPEEERIQELLLTLQSSSFFLSLFFVFLFNYLFAQAVPMVLFDKLRPLQAMILSMKIAFKAFPVLLPFYLVLVLASVSGMVLLGLGILLSFGLYFCGVYAMYSLSKDQRMQMMENLMGVEHISKEEV